MRELGPEKIVPVVFSHGANNSVMYGNRRAELHDKLLRWLSGKVSMPNDKMAQEEAAAYKWGLSGCRRDETARLFMTPKEKIKGCNRPVAGSMGRVRYFDGDRGLVRSISKSSGLSPPKLLNLGLYGGS